MTASTLTERPPAADARPALPALAPVRLERDRSRRRASAPVVAMVSGLLTVAAAVGILTSANGGAGPTRRPSTGAAPVSTAAPTDPMAITLSARDVAVVNQVYEPGQESGWHRHAGIHAVAVLSGTLTVYDGQCLAQTVEPGRPYVGGQELHMVRNETSTPAEMVVTYLNPSTPSGSTHRLAAPSGCELSRS